MFTLMGKSSVACKVYATLEPHLDVVDTRMQRYKPNVMTPCILYCKYYRKVILNETMQQFISQTQ